MLFLARLAAILLEACAKHYLVQPQTSQPSKQQMNTNSSSNQ